MLKKLCFLLLIVFAAHMLYAQKKTAYATYEKYLDFNLARLQGENDKALELGLGILDSAAKLPPKARTSFYNGMGKIYEDNDVPDMAIRYYEMVATAAPNYYVVHRALGYLYLTPADNLFARLNSVKKTDPTYADIKQQYNAAAKKALQHLEIAQACDPGDDTLDIIKILYKNVGDTNGLTTLSTRLANLNKNCLDILSDN